MWDLTLMTIFINHPLYVGFFSSSQYRTGVLHLNHSNVFNSKVSDMSKKIEKIKSIQLQLVLENSKTKEQIKNPLVVKEPKNQPISEEERIFGILEESIDKKIRE
jgi:hypothetical protein